MTPESAKTQACALSLAAANAARPWMKAVTAVGLTVIAGIGAWLPVFRDRLQDHYALTNVRFGLLLNIGFAAGVAGALAGGRLMAKIGPEKTFRLCLAGCAAGLLLGAIPGTWTLLLAALAVTALFIAPLNIALQANLMNMFPGSRRKVLSFSLVAFALFGMVFPLLAEWLMALAAVGDRWTFGLILHGLLGLAGVVVLLGAVAWNRSTSTQDVSFAESTPDNPAMPAGAVVLLVVLLVLHGTIDSVLFTWMPRVLSSATYASHPVVPGAVIAAYSLAYVVSRLLLGIIPEERWRRRLMVVPGLAGGALLMAGILSRSQALTAAGYVAGAFVWSVECPVFLAALGGAGRRFGPAMAMVNVGSGLATFGLGTALGFLCDRLGDERLWQIILVPACGFPVVGLAGLLWVLKYSEPFRSSRCEMRCKCVAS
ncbi:MAG: MFS transporter [Kiritimatiellia bacterium]